MLADATLPYSRLLGKILIFFLELAICGGRIGGNTIGWRISSLTRQMRIVGLIYYRNPAGWRRHSDIGIVYLGDPVCEDSSNNNQKTKEWDMSSR